MKSVLIILLTVITLLIYLPAFAQNHVLSLDGDGDYVEIEDGEALNSINSQVTMEAWIKATAFPNQWMPIIYKGGKRTPSFALWLSRNDGILHLASSVPSGQTQIDLYSPIGSIALNTWYHVAGIIDAKSGAMKILINGGEVASRGFGKDIQVSSLPLRIGWTHEDEPNYSPFAGQIDEVRIWNIARTQEEIKTKMHTTLSGKEPGLAGYWRFDDEQNTVTDLSPHRSDGVLMDDAHFVEAELPRPGELVIPTVLSGTITDEAGKPIRNASVRLEQDGEEIAQTQADSSGSYRIVIFHPVSGLYDLSAAAGERGDWQFGIRLREGEHRTLNLTLKEVISIEGTLLMLDDKTPHVAVPVQAVISSRGDSLARPIATTLSDEDGKYRLINLKPGRYLVRCYTPGKYVYYEQVREAIPQSGEGKGANGQKGNTQYGETLQVERGNTLKNIDFRFPPFKKGMWKNYTLLDGLASDRIWAIHRDPDGVMWFGTWNGGVSRYDGKEFVNFTTKDGLADNRVHAIYRDPDGVMWFGTWGGVSRYDGKKFVTFTTKDGLAHDSVLAIDCFVPRNDPNGVMWFGTGDYNKGGGGGVSRYDGKEFVTFTTKDGLADNTVQSIYCGADGVVWFGTNGGLSRYDGKEFVTFTTKDGLADNSVRAIHRDPDGVMWFGTRDGVSRYDGKEFANFTTKDGLASNWVLAIHRNPDGVLWLGTWAGVSRYDGKGFVNITTKDGLAGNVVQAIHCNPDGVMWFGTQVNGVSRYDGKELVNFTTKDGLAENKVHAIYRDPDGVMWFGTWWGGVSQYDGKEFVNFTTKDGLAGNWVFAIHRNLDGVMWFGTYGGLSWYDGKEFVNFTTKDGLSGNRVNAIDCNPDGVMWLATYGGVSRYDGKEFVSFTAEDGLANNDVWTSYCDPDGIMWFGTWAGVSRYDGRKFITFATKDSLANIVTAIHRDTDGVMWFGAEGGLSRAVYPELMRRDGKTLTILTAKDGFVHNAVYAIHQDPDGVMWFGTDGGVACYDGIAWTSLDTRDGLAGNNVKAIHQAPDGLFWFGTDRGITRYRRSTVPPKVEIVSVTTDQTYRDLSAIPTFTIGTRATIEYNAIDFKTVPEKRQYRVCIVEDIMDGSSLKKDAEYWLHPTKESSFDYTFENPGAYTFAVQAIDRDLNYSQPASITLKVVSPFYMQASFLVPFVGLSTILLVTLTVSLIFLVKHRRQVRAYERAAVQELRDANQVQMSLMPETAPEIEGVEIAGKCIPANTVSGDFFDYLEGKRPNEVALVVADVTGKAMKGAMNAVMTDGILRATAMEQGEFTPASLMMTLNNVLKVGMERNMNVTMVISTLDVETKTLTLANAGHHALPLLLRDGEIQPLKAVGLPLGMMAGIEYDEEQFQLEGDDVLIFMTDGIIEAEDSEEQMYSDSGRLEKTISQFTNEMSAESMVNAIINDAIDFGGEKAARDDDMTVVVAKLL